MSVNKKILFISALNGDAWGGSEVFWFTMATSLAQQGHQVTVAWLHWPQRQAKNEQLAAAGCTVIPLPNHRFAGNPLQKLLRKQRAAALLKETVTSGQYQQVLISQGGFEDVIHGPFNSLQSLLHNYVLVHHNYNSSQRLSATRAARLQRWVQGATLNLGASQQIFAAMPAMAGFEMPNCAVLYNPISFEPEQTPAEWPPLQQGNYVLTVLAQLDCARKAQDVLITTLAHPKWLGRNWELRLYGEGKDRPLLETLVKTTGLQDKIFLKGHSPNAKAVLAQTHILLQLTHIDAMPIAVVEAMNMARACLVTRVGDMPQWVTEGFNGFLAEAATVTALDAVLEKAWQLRNQWKQMGQQAFDTFTQKYPISYEGYYSNIILNA